MTVVCHRATHSSQQPRATRSVISPSFALCLLPGTHPVPALGHRHPEARAPNGRAHRLTVGGQASGDGVVHRVRRQGLGLGDFVRAPSPAPRGRGGRRRSATLPRRCCGCKPVNTKRACMFPSSGTTDLPAGAAAVPAGFAPGAVWGDQLSSWRRTRRGRGGRQATADPSRWLGCRPMRSSGGIQPPRWRCSPPCSRTR